MDGEKTEVLNNFLASVFLASMWPTFLPKLSSGWRLREQRASPVNEDQVHHHLKSLNVHNSMGPDETHPRVLRELVDAVAKPLFRTFEKLEQPGEDTVTAKRETLYPSLKIVERKTLGALHLSASRPSLHGKIMELMLLESAEAHGEEKGDSRQPSQLNQGQVLVSELERWIQWVEHYMDKKMIEWSHPEGNGQQLRTPTKMTDK